MINKKRLAMMALAASMVLPNNLVALSNATTVLAVDDQQGAGDQQGTELKTALSTATTDINGNKILPAGTYTLNEELTTNYSIFISSGFTTISGTGTIKSNKSILELDQPDIDLTLSGITLKEEKVDNKCSNWTMRLLSQAESAKVKLSGVTIDTPISGFTVNGLMFPADENKFPEITFDDVTINANNLGIYQAGLSNITVNRGTIITPEDSGIEVRAGNLVVDGTTIKATNTAQLVVNPNGNGSTSDHAGIAIAQHTTKKPIDVTIKNATITAYAPLVITDPENNQEAEEAPGAITVSVDGASTLTTNNTDASTSYAIGYTKKLNASLTVDSSNAAAESIRKLNKNTLNPIPDISDYDLTGQIVYAPATEEAKEEIDPQLTLKPTAESAEADIIDLEAQKAVITYSPETFTPGTPVDVTVTIDDSEEYVGTITKSLPVIGDFSAAKVFSADGGTSVLLPAELNLEDLSPTGLNKAISQAISVKFEDQEVEKDQYTVKEVKVNGDNKSGTVTLTPAEDSDYINDLEFTFSQMVEEVTVTVSPEDDNAGLLTGITLSFELDNLIDKNEDTEDSSTYIPDYEKISEKLTEEIHAKFENDPTYSFIKDYGFVVEPNDSEPNEDDAVKKDEETLPLTAASVSVKVQLKNESLICLKISPKASEGEGELAPVLMLLEEAPLEEKTPTVTKDADGNVNIKDTFGNIDRDSNGSITGSDLIDYVGANAPEEYEISTDALDIPVTYSLDKDELQSLADIDKETKIFTQQVAAPGVVDLSDSKLVTVTLANGPYYLNNGECKPAVTVKVVGSDTPLTEGTDYTLTYKQNDQVGTATVVITGIGDEENNTGYTGTRELTFEITTPVSAPASSGGSSKPKPKPEEPAAPVVGTPTAMYRLYNRLTGEHLFTTDKNERDNLLTSDTWKDEGQGWTAPSVSDTPVYRLLNPNTGDHHYTTDKNEFDTLPSYGWVAEGIAFFSADKDNAENVILHRLYNPNATGAGSHHYTADTNERDTLVAQGWKYEGTAWAGLPAGK